jgi:5'(3')-deoxyribonucleotidase
LEEFWVRAVVIHSKSAHINEKFADKPLFSHRAFEFCSRSWLQKKSFFCDDQCLTISRIAWLFEGIDVLFHSRWNEDLVSDHKSLINGLDNDQYSEENQ